MNFDTVNKDLMKKIPEIKPFYDKELERWHGEEPGPQIVFEYVINPYLINLLEINEDKELISRIFDFIEKMATCDDFLVQHVVELTVLEGLAEDETILTKSPKYMGKETKRMCDEVVFINYNNVDKLLIKEIPEFTSFHDEEVKLWKGYGPLQMNLFSDAFNPYLINLLEINEDEELLSRIFAFLEKMATCDNFLVQQIVKDTVLERLGDDKTILTKAQKYMGKETKRMCDESGLMNYNEAGVMIYSNVDKKLIKEIPELKLFYDKELERWKGQKPGQHNIFGNVLNPYLINLLEINEDEELLSRIFAFLEKMATCYDSKVQDVLGATVLERLGDDKTILAKSQKYMDKETKKTSYEVEKGWGRI